MDLPTFVFKKAIKARRGLGRWVWGTIRNAIVKWRNDPACIMRIHGREMAINLSHALPMYQSQYPFYDTLPRRLGDFLRRRYGPLRGVDVGANIGDSIAAFVKTNSDRFLAIEPNPRFFQLLRRNWPDSEQVLALGVLCSSSDGIGNYDVYEHAGTASLVSGEKGTEVPVRRLDTLLDQHEWTNVSVVKVDTDGYDLDVLGGAERVLETSRPAVMFECDVFDNPEYYTKVLSAFALLERCGYANFILYDNLGYPLGKYSIGDKAAIKNALFYQLTGGVKYYDILVMQTPDLRDFYLDEMVFFASHLSHARRVSAEAVVAASK